MSNATETTDGGGVNVRFAAKGTPTRDWDEPSFSNVQGWPGCAMFHEQRLWLAGSLGQPDAIWGSKIAQYFDFDVGDGLDNEAIWATVGSDDVSTIRHIVSDQTLMVLTATGEYAVPGAEGRAVTPSTFRLARQSSYGSASVRPAVFDGAVMTVGSNRRGVREYSFSDARRTYEATDLNVIASHIVSDVVEMAYVYGSDLRQEQYLFVVNGDGTMAVFHSSRAEKLAGWALWTSPGVTGTDVIESVVTLGTRVFVAVRRGNQRWLEYFEPQPTHTLDAAMVLQAAQPTASWTLPLFYRGKTVKVVGSDGRFIGQFEVPSSGAITLPSAVSRAIAGFDYPVEVETLPIDLELPIGSFFGEQRRIARITAIVDETLDIRVRGQHLVVQGLRPPPYEPPRTLDEGTWRFDEDGAFAPLRFDDAPPVPPGPQPVTGARQFAALGYSRQPTIKVTQAEPAPMRLLGLIAEVAF